MGKSEAVAALRSAAKACELCAGVASDTDAAEWRADAERVRTIADALEQAETQKPWTDHDGADYPEQWIVNAPRIT